MESKRRSSKKQLKLPDARTILKDYCSLPDSGKREAVNEAASKEYGIIHARNRQRLASESSKAGGELPSRMALGYFKSNHSAA